MKDRVLLIVWGAVILGFIAAGFLTAQEGLYIDTSPRFRTVATFYDSLVNKKDTITINAHVGVTNGYVALEYVVDTLKIYQAGSVTDTTLCYMHSDTMWKLKLKFGNWTPYFNSRTGEHLTNIPVDSFIYDADSAKYSWEYADFDSLPYGMHKYGEIQRIRMPAVNFTEYLRYMIIADTLISDTSKLFIRGRFIAQ